MAFVSFPSYIKALSDNGVYAEKAVFFLSFWKVDRHLRKLDQELAKFKMELEADNAGITEVLEKSKGSIQWRHVTL